MEQVYRPERGKGRRTWTFVARSHHPPFVKSTVCSLVQPNATPPQADSQVAWYMGYELMIGNRTCPEPVPSLDGPL